jgi:molecular chaperone Hsp33
MTQAPRAMTTSPPTTGPAAAGSDHVLRAMTDDGSFRVIAATTTAMVEGAIAAQSARGATARWFGELLTGAVLYRETMAPQLRVQAILMGASGRLVADSHPDGGTRGLVTLPASAGGQLQLGPAALLQVMRSLPNGALHQGVVSVASAGGISGAFMAYLQTSEQVVSMAAVGCVLDGEARVAAAGGYLLQLLPEVREGPLALMTERLRDFEDIDGLLATTAAEPAALVAELFYGMPFTPLARNPLSFQCRCSHSRLVASLATLARADIAEMVGDARPLDITCDYCGKAYNINPEQLRGLLETS